MLSMDSKQYVNAYQYSAGMLNVGWVAGYAHHAVAVAGNENGKVIYVMQTNNLNHALPVHIRDGDRLPARFKENTEIKAICRVAGRRLEDGTRIAVLEGLDFDTPTVLDMPPEENWHFKVPEEAPSADFKPSKNGLTLSRRSNVIKIAGYVAGINITPSGAVKANGNTSNGRLELLIAQKENLDLAIPVRIDGKFAEAVARVVKIGMPLLFNDGQFKVNVDKTGAPAGEDGIVPVKFYPYIEARVPKIASPDDILGATPAWAIALANTSRARRAQPKPSAPVAAPAAVTPPSALDAAMSELS